jgi:hypothetical protein
MNNCLHKLVEYIGFTDSYNYCSLCNKKESELTVEKFLVPKYAEEEIHSTFKKITDEISLGIKTPGVISWLKYPMSITDGFFGVNRSNYPPAYRDSTPARCDVVRELIEQGLLSPKEGRKLLEFDDLESISGIVTALDRTTGTITIKIDDPEVLMGLELGTEVTFNE